LPHGYHVYRYSEFNLAAEGTWATADQTLTVGARQSEPVFTGGWHELLYRLPRQQEIDAGGQTFGEYALRYPGHLWLAPGFALLEIRSEVVHGLAEVLQNAGAPLTRLVLPTLRAIYDDLPTPKQAIRTHHSDSSNRLSIAVRGADIDADQRNLDELNSGRLAEVEFTFNGRATVLYATGTMLLRGTYPDGLAAASEAWEIWRTYCAGRAVPWSRGWWRRT
jgi:hypothetical protein